MSKVDFSQEQLLAQKDMERLLWKVFWSYSKELGLEENEEIKEEMTCRASNLIPAFAASTVEFELLFDYPLIDFFIASLESDQNLFTMPDVQRLMQIKGPSNDAKLARFVIEMQEDK